MPDEIDWTIDSDWMKARLRWYERIETAIDPATTAIDEAIE